MNVRSLLFGLLSGIVVSTSLSASIVRADDAPGLVQMGDSDMSDERARAHFKAGTSLYESGRFNEAAEEWEKAHQLSGRAALLYNIYVAHRDASNLPKAIDALSRYLATNDADATQRLNLEARLAAMQAAQATADEQRKASEAQAAQAAAAQREPAEPAPASQPAGSSESSEAVPVLPLTLVITGGAMLTGGLVLGLVTQSKVSDIEDRCPGDRCPASFDLDGERSSARTLALVTDVLWIGGVVVGGVGAVLWLTASGDDSEARASASLVPSLACVPGACAGSLRGSF